MLNSQVKLLVCFQEVANLGVTDPSLGLISVNVSETFCLTIFPTTDRVASHGSTMSGSSAMTTVIFFPAEKAGDKKLETTKIEAVVIAKGI